MPPKSDDFQSLLQDATDELDDLISDIKQTNLLGHKTVTDPSQLKLFHAQISRLDGTFDAFCRRLADAKRYTRKLGQSSEQFDAMRESVRALYFEALSMDVSKEPQASTSSSFSERVSPGVHINLPVIQIPTFNGDLSNWVPFRDTFTSLVHDNQNLTGVQKLHYLKGSLKGQAAQIISSIGISDAGYSQAWHALIKRFDNKVIQATNHLMKIFNFQPLLRHNIVSLEQFSAVVVENAIAFRNLDLADPDGFILLTFALHLLDSKTRERFENEYLSSDTIPTFEDFRNFIQNQHIRLQSNAMTAPSSSNISNLLPTNKHPRPSKQVLMMTDQVPETACFVCQGNHRIYDCERFRSWEPKQRFTHIKEARHCINCLASGHSTAQCPSLSSCRRCQQRHHTLLHFPPINTSNTVRGGNRSRVNKTSSKSAVLTPNTHAPNNVPLQSNSIAAAEAKDSVLSSSDTVATQVLLGTARALIRDHLGQHHEIRLVIDSGSQRSFITEGFARKLGLPFTNNPHRLCGFAESFIPGGSCQIKCILTPRNKKHTLLANAVVIDQISGPMPLHPIPENIIALFAGYELADPTYFDPHPIDFLLGADLFGRIITGEMVTHGTELPTGLQTVFGLVVLGPVRALTTNESEVVLFANQNDNQSSLDNLLQKFWELEEVPSASRLKPEDVLCEQHFATNHSRDNEGRFMVRLPFNNNVIGLGPSRHIAAYRFQRLEVKLDRAPDLKKEYSQIIRKYMEMDYVSVAIHEGKYFMPHHGVFKNSPNSKMRIVFDASTQTAQGSLNDRLLTGPKLQSDIQHVLLNFRLFRFVFTADIEQMYLQIVVHPEDRSYLHFLYRFNNDEALKEFEFHRVPFGLSCSPFLAMRVIQQLIENEGKEFPLASNTLKAHRYIDDILTGANSIDTAIQMQHELIDLLQKGCFKLKKWASNSSELLERVPHDEIQAPVLLSNLEESSIKLLGMQWEPSQDYLSYEVNLGSKFSFTKRGIMSVIARIYDPLGYLSPVTFRAKTLLQTLWKNKLGWDAPLPSEVAEEWQFFLSELPKLQFIKIPRHLFAGGVKNITICGFADASTAGYAAVIYLICEDPQGGVDSKLVLSKTRVAPVKPTTVPRLELCAAVLLVKCFDFLKPFLDQLQVVRTYLLSDSSIVLSWLRLEPSRLKTFVANRVARIMTSSELSQWHHVASVNNVADVASRGLSPRVLVNREDWWRGPEWLRTPSSQWPITSKFSFPEAHAIPELKAVPVLSSQQLKTPFFVELSERFSSYDKLVRVVICLLRFIHLARRPSGGHPSGTLLSGYKRASQLLVKGVQQHYFRDEIPLDNSKSLKSLSPFIDADGIIRVGGRLQNSSLKYDAKHPFILPSNAHLTNLIVDRFHQIYLHAGPRLLHSLLRQKFWIPSARKIIKFRLRKCLACHRRTVKNFTPIMGNLPQSRFEEGRAFLNVGIDFAGPYFIKDSNRRKSSVSKAYIALYICFSTKAMHLELVSSLTTEAFLASLERFIARRGCPSKIFSDNGKNFLGAYNHLKDLIAWWSRPETQSQIENHLVIKDIQWDFIPPLAPHFGGLWEAGVKSFKYHLDRVLNSQPLTFEEFATLATNIEAMLNSRPLYSLTADHDDFGVLTPGHFLIGGPLLSVPEYDYTDTKQNRLSRWQFLQQCIQQIWKRWRLDYLHELQQRGKWTRGDPKVEVGTLVLLREPNVPPLEWPTGRVTETFPGPDGVVRVVKLRTSKGEYTRSVARLAPLLTPDHS